MNDPVTKKVVQYCPSLGTPCGIAAYTEMLCNAMGCTSIKSLEEIDNDIPTHLHVQHEFSIISPAVLKKIMVYCHEHKICLYITMHSVVPIRNIKSLSALYPWLQLYRSVKVVIIRAFLKTDKEMGGKAQPTDGSAQNGMVPPRASKRGFSGPLKNLWRMAGQLTVKAASRFGLDLGTIDFAASQLLVINNAAKIIVHSEISKQIWLTLGADSGQIEVFHHPVKRFQTSDTLYSDSENKIHVGCFGFLRKDKCVLEIIEACKDIQNCILHIYASTSHKNCPLDYEKKVIKQANTHGWIKLHRAHLPLAKVVFSLSKCDVNVWYASQNPKYISVSGSIRQYLAAKRPVIASDIAMVSDVRDILQLVPPKRHHLLAKAIKNCSNHTGKIENYIGKHTWDRVEINYI